VGYHPRSDGGCHHAYRHPAFFLEGMVSTAEEDSEEGQMVSVGAGTPIYRPAELKSVRVTQGEKERS